MSKKIFIVYGHHNTQKSFNASIRDTFIDEANKLNVDGKCKIAAKHNVKLLRTLIKDDNYSDHDSDNEYLSDTDKYVNNIELTEELQEIRTNAALNDNARSKSMLRHNNEQRSNLQKRLDSRIKSRTLPKLDDAMIIMELK